MSLQTQGLLGKVHLLNGHTQRSVEMDRLGLPTVDIKDLFHSQRLASRAFPGRIMAEEPLNATNDMSPQTSPIRTSSSLPSVVSSSSRIYVIGADPDAHNRHADPSKVPVELLVSCHRLMFLHMFIALEKS